MIGGSTPQKVITPLSPRGGVGGEACQTVCYEVDALCGASGEDNLFRLTGVDKLPHRLACRFVQVGSLLREVVNAAVDIGVDVEVFVAHGIKHAERFLRGGRIVEIDERAAVDLAAEDGEVGAYLL